MSKIRSDQNEYSFDIPTNKYGYTEEEWAEFSPEIKSYLVRYHNKGITRKYIWEKFDNNPKWVYNKIDYIKRKASRDKRDDFSSEYWENHPRNCEKFAVLDCRCEMCFAEQDDPYHSAHKISSHRRD